MVTHVTSFSLSGSYVTFCSAGKDCKLSCKLQGINVANVEWSVNGKKVCVSAIL